MAEYDGSIDGAPDPAVVDTSGNGTMGGMVGGLFGGLSQALQDALNIIGQTLGIPAAQASNYSVVNSQGVPIGYLTLTGIMGLTLAQALAAKAAALDIASGRVLDRNGGKAGFVDLDSTNTGGPPMVGPINAYDLTQSVSTSTPAGTAITASVPGSLALQLNTIDGFPLSRVGPILWRPTVVNTYGIPIIDYSNCMNIFSWNPQIPAYLHPCFIGGKDGIYSIHTGRRVIPDASVGPAPLGYGLGGAATYQRANFAIGWTSGGRAFAWWTGDVQHCLDPSTNAIPVIAASYEMQCWDGSQQISTCGYQYDTPTPPTAASPGYNTTVAGKMAYVNNGITNNAFITVTGGGNPGGPDGGPSR